MTNAIEPSEMNLLRNANVIREQPSYLKMKESNPDQEPEVLVPVRTFITEPLILQLKFYRVDVSFCKSMPRRSRLSIL